MNISNQTKLGPIFHDIFITQGTVIIQPESGCQGLDHEKRNELHECEDGIKAGEL